MEREKEDRNSAVGENDQRGQDQAKELVDARNDALELRENARNRQITHEWAIQNEAMRKLLQEAEKMPREVFDQLPAVNDWNTRKTLVEHGIPDPKDPPNPLMFRNASQTPLHELANQAWGNTLAEATTKAVREDERKAELASPNKKRETLVDRIKRETKEREKDMSPARRLEQEHNPTVDRTRR